ncbi:hypothetical protein [Aquihabitans sp. McL0605]|uniref:hypothetical protein n=1 Tax=Aquihabitans sp. McL0605 TaxID=3415671 RepID=UPI003CF95AF9
MTGPSRDAQVVVLAYDVASDGLIDLLDVLGRHAVVADIVLVGEGGPLAPLRAYGQVTVADRFRRRGLGAVAQLVGARRLASGLKGVRVRQALRARAALPWIVQDPRAAALVRHAPARPTRLAAALGAAGALPSDLVPADLETLSDADVWLTATDGQRAAIGARSSAPALLLDPGAGQVIDRPGDGPERWPVVLLPTPGAWDEVNHTIEVVAHLARHHPDVEVLWVADGAEDRWLAEHDLRHLGTASAVTIVTAAEVARRAFRALVLTGYHRTDLPLVHRANAVGAPVLGFRPPDDPTPAGRGRGPADGRARPGAPAVAPFAVEALAQAVDRALADDQFELPRRLMAQRREDRVQLARTLAALFETLGIDADTTPS